VDRKDEAALRRRKQSEHKMVIKQDELKVLTREEWLAMDRRELEKQFAIIETEYPLIEHTDAGRTFSMVRRMQVEKALNLPITLRSGYAISTKNGKAADEMTEDEWEDFYFELSNELNRAHPHLYRILFSVKRRRSATELN
jgi:hypothetical protein